MAGLILKLRPYEQLLINGVIVENGDRKTRLRVCTEGAHILRLRDAMRPEDATTPLKRAYYAAQMAVAGELTAPQAALLIDQAMDAYGGISRPHDRENIDAYASEGDYYKLMRVLGDMIDSDPKEAFIPAEEMAAAHH